MAASALSQDAAVPTSPSEDPRAAQVRSLLDGTLDVSVDPQSLFDTPLEDAAAMRVEAARIRALLSLRQEAAAAPKRGATDPAAKALLELDAAQLEARLALDRARLAFYELPTELRAQVLLAHSARRSPDISPPPPPATSDESTHHTAAARSEAEQLVAEELARLGGLERKLARARAELQAEREELVARGDATLGWQRRARDAKAGSPADADATHDALRSALSASRDALERALDELERPRSRLPPIGPDPLLQLPAQISIAEATARRQALERESAAARAAEQALRADRTELLLDEVSTLNRERLGLLPHLSPSRRAAITGFTAAGFEQAHAEARHLRLILRYHRYVALRWVATLQAAPWGAAPMWRVGSVAVPWLLAVVVFAWWRRRSAALFALVEERLVEIDRSERRTTPSSARRLVRLLRQIHRPLEWLVLFAATLWLLPAEVQELLEVQLLTVIVGWSLGASLIVNVINALATYSTSARLSPRAASYESLRLRSLRLVGRVSVIFILVLLLTARLVGQGSLYALVLSSGWLVATIVYLVLVRWWRETVFERVARARKKSPLQAWVLANRSGWKSFFAAMIAAVQLFAVGAFKAVSNWLSGFDVARRAHAYLFKREVDRLAAGEHAGEARPLSGAAYAYLAPDAVDDAWTPCPADEPYELIARRAQEGRSGTLGIIGGRGMGKSTLLRRLANAHAGAEVVSLRGGSIETVREALARARTLQAGPKPALILLDDVGALVKPVLGGLSAFDELLALARANSALWVFAIDAVIWPFLRRARDARPLFDEVLPLRSWSEEQIGELLLCRSARAGVTPTFEALLEKLPPSADEFDRQEALNAKRAGYFRMVWDYARGNPASALEVWRSSLVEDASGVVRVRSLQTPDAAQLELLPDAALFILRAVLQLTPASVADVARATRLSEAQVEDAFKYGQTRGYLAAEGTGVRVTWAWRRSVLQIMERRRLLVSP